MSADPASSMLNAAARDVLRPMGLHRKGRSRTWWDDRGWWLGVVEFQPSGFGKASYLNVGISWLWTAESQPHTSFDLGYRVPGVGGSFESEPQWRAVVDELVRRAAGEVVRNRDLVPDLAAAARECVRQEDARVADLRERRGGDRVPPGWPTWHAAVASGLAGDVEAAVHYFEAVAQSPAEPDYWVTVRERAAAWSHLVRADRRAFTEDVRRHVEKQRQALKLPAVAADQCD